jgi:hypothetical protein
MPDSAERRLPPALQTFGADFAAAIARADQPSADAEEHAVNRRPRRLAPPRFRRQPRRPGLSRRILVPAGTAALAVAAGIVVYGAIATTPTHEHSSSPVIHAVPVSFRFPKSGPDSGYIVATVTNPFAAQSSLNAAFQAAHLNITVILEPASPSVVGTVLGTSTSTSSTGPQIQAVGSRGACVTGGGGPCNLEIKIPRDYSGQGTIELGRPAKPGEAYVATTSSFAPGEALHCSGLLNEQVAQALPTIEADNITAYWGVPGNDPPPTLGATSGPQVPDTTPPPGNYHIVSADPIAAGIVWFRAAPDPLSATDMQQAQQSYNQGC